jgi:hypothetical protein
MDEKTEEKVEKYDASSIKVLEGLEAVASARPCISALREFCTTRSTGG